MATSVTACTHCGRTFKVADAFRGRRARCRACGGSFVILFDGETLGEGAAADGQLAPTQAGQQVSPAAADQPMEAPLTAASSEQPVEPASASASASESGPPPDDAPVFAVGSAETPGAAGIAVASVAGGSDGGSTTAGATTASPPQSPKSVKSAGRKVGRKATKKARRAARNTESRRSGYRKAEGVDSAESGRDLGQDPGQDLGQDPGQDLGREPDQTADRQLISGTGSEAARRVSLAEDSLRDSQDQFDEAETSLARILAKVSDAEQSVKANALRHKETQSRIEAVSEELKAREVELADRERALTEASAAAQVAISEQVEQQQRAEAATQKAQQADAQQAELEARCAELEARNTEAEARNVEAEARHAGAVAHIAEAETRNSEVEARATELESRVESLETAAREAETRRDDALHQREDLDASCEEGQAKLDTVGQQLTEGRERLEALLAEGRQKLETQSAETREQLATELAEGRQRLETELAEGQQRQAAELAEGQQRLATELAAGQQQLDTLVEEVAAAEQRLAKAVAEQERVADEAAVRAEEDAARRAEADAQLEARRADIETLDGRRAESERAFVAQVARTQESEEVLAEINGRLSAVTDELRATETTLEEHRKMLARAQEENDRLVRENAEFELRLETLTDQESALRAVHATVEADRMRLHGAVNQLQERETVLREGVETAEALLTERRAELARQDSELEDQRADLEFTEQQLKAVTEAVERARGVHDELVANSEARTRRFEEDRVALEARLSEVRFELDQAEEEAVERRAHLQQREGVLEARVAEFEKEIEVMSESRERAAGELSVVEADLMSSRETTERNLIAAREARTAREQVEQELATLNEAWSKRRTTLESEQRELQKHIEAASESEVRLVGRRDEAEVNLNDVLTRLEAAREDHAQMLEKIRATRDEARNQFQRAGDMLAGILEAQRQAGDLVEAEAGQLEQELAASARRLAAADGKAPNPGQAKARAGEPEALEDSDMEELPKN